MKKVWLDYVYYYWACKRCNDWITNLSTSRCACGYDFVGEEPE